MNYNNLEPNILNIINKERRIVSSYDKLEPGQRLFPIFSVNFLGGSIFKIKDETPIKIENDLYNIREANKELILKR